VLKGQGLLTEEEFARSAEFSSAGCKCAVLDDGPGAGGVEGCLD
jgi:hypothetical protein